MFSFKPKYNKISDEDLMKGIQAGDQKAFNELYNRYSSRMQYYFYRMLGNSGEKAKDFLQDLFYKLISKPELFDCSKKFSTWIYSVAHNMCKNEYRSNEIRQQAYIEDLSYFENEKSGQNSSAREKEYDELVKIVFKELEAYDETHKTVFILKYREGFDLKEIAEIAGISVGTVKSRLFTTKKKLMEKLEPYKEVYYKD